MTQKKSPAVKKPPTESFRMKLGDPGKVWTTDEMRAMMMRAVDHLEASGITHVKSCNFYVPPVDEAGKPIVRVLGRALQDIVIKAPYRSVADEYGL